MNIKYQNLEKLNLTEEEIPDGEVFYGSVGTSDTGLFLKVGGNFYPLFESCAGGHHWTPGCGVNLYRKVKSIEVTL